MALEEGLDAADADLLDDTDGPDALEGLEETDALDAASDPLPGDYPYGPMAIDQRSRTLSNR